MSYGADLRQADAWGQTALHWAAAAPERTDSQSESALDVCLKQARNTVHARNTVGMTPLHWASAWGRLPAAQALLNAGADTGAVDVRRSSPAAMVDRIRASARTGAAAGDGLAAAEERDAEEQASAADCEARMAMLNVLSGAP